MGKEGASQNELEQLQVFESSKLILRDIEGCKVQGARFTVNSER